MAKLHAFKERAEARFNELRILEIQFELLVDVIGVGRCEVSELESV
jgi:hypothetical protein